MCTRRNFLSGALAACICPTWARGAGGSLPSPGPDDRAARDMVTAGAQEAIDQGIGYLVKNQRSDGSFGTGQHVGNVAITSLAGLALMAGGHLPGQTPLGKTVLGALEFVLNQEEGHRGYLYNKAGTPHGPMYGHGFGTLFLAELYGMVHVRRARDRLRSTLKRAVELIIASQNAKGGWRYYPESTDADISVTICQIMALRAARNAGLSVPKTTVERCIKYVKSCQEPEGGFRYMDHGGAAAFARTAAGVVALYSAGLYRDPAIERGLKYLSRYKPRKDLPRHDVHYFYGQYYAAQAMWTAGGAYWSEWYPAIRDELIGKSRPAESVRSWVDAICPHYATAMACIILQIPNNYLPILQK
jgi:hypothetical protein